LKIARSMLANGLDRTLVMELTGLSAEELAKIHH
jgi:predicted transposase YdaD